MEIANETVPSNMDENREAKWKLTVLSSFQFLSNLYEPVTTIENTLNKVDKNGTGKDKMMQMEKVSSENEENTSQKPNFGFIYKEFERKKKATETIAPSREMAWPEFHPMMAPTNRNAIPFKSEENLFLGAINAFMCTHSQPSFPVKFTSAHDWTREAQALLEEVQRYKEPPARSSFMWPINKRKISEDSESGISSDSAEKTEDQDDRSSIVRTVTESSDGSNSSNDESLNENGYNESNTSVQKSDFGPIGHRWSVKGDLVRSSSLDSGYQSATDYEGASSRCPEATVSDTEHVIEGSRSREREMNTWSENARRPCSPSSPPPISRSIAPIEPISPIKLDPLATPFSINPWMCTSRNPISNETTCSEHNISTASCSSLRSTDKGYPRHKKWITEEILEMIAVRDKLYRRMKVHPSPDLINMYKKVRNMVVGMTRNAKRAYEKKLQDSRDEQSMSLYKSYKYRQPTASFR